MSVKQRLEGFQKPASQPGAKQVRLARISYDGATAICSCGWSHMHVRDKVREDAIDRHLKRKHNGRGIRL